VTKDTTNAREVTKTLLEIAEAEGNPVTNLKVQKLLYFAHGLCLAKYDLPLVAGESFQAWRYGPVIESLYHHLKIFGDSQIPPSSPFLSTWNVLGNGAEDTQRRSCLYSIFKQFGAMPGGRLIEISHDKNGPWASTYRDNSFGIEVPNSEIKNYFLTKLVRK